MLGRGLRVTVFGVGIGTLLAIFAKRFFVQQIPGLNNSPWILAGVTALLFLITVLACLVPIRRALAVDPLTALRVE